MLQRKRDFSFQKGFGSVVWIAAFIYVAIHLLVIVFTQQATVSIFMVMTLGAVKIAYCGWLFKVLAPNPARFRWLLVGIAGLSTQISNGIYTWRAVVQKNTDYLSETGSFLVALSCISLLLSITLNFRKTVPLAVRLIDALFCLMLGFLFFEIIYAPTGIGHNFSLTNRLIDLEYSFLLFCAACQFLASDGEEGQRDRRFLYVIFLYTGFSTSLLAVRNRFAASSGNIYWDLALDISVLSFIFLAAKREPGWVRGLALPVQIVRLARGGVSLFVGLAAILLAIAVSSDDFFLGNACVVLGVIAYGLRNAITHSKMLEAEGRLLIAQTELELLASRDGLTGIPNRRLFDKTMDAAWSVLTRRGGQLAVLMIDIDLFKQLNDSYGHQTGDACLIAVARSLQDLLPRAGDFVGRYGGEEFAVILPDTSSSGARAVAERLRLGIEALAIPQSKSPYGCVTVSVGAAVGDEASVTDFRHLVKSADEALYLAKDAGRNRVELIDLTQLQNPFEKKPAKQGPAATF